MPIPVVAFDTGARGMEEAETFEAQHSEVAKWALSEFMSLETGFRKMLDPIYPQPKVFDIVDAQIADIIAQGELEKKAIAEAIEQIEVRQEQLSSEAVTTQGATIDESSIMYANLTEVNNTFNGSFDGIGDMTPEVEVINEDGVLLSLDTSDGVDLPNVTVDPRNGGTYESEIETAQDVFDVIQQGQDQVPEPIQTKGNDLYNQITGTEPPA